MPHRGSFKTKLSFYLLAIGSACGLGNIWRFPYVVGDNGGGAFLLLYIFLSFTLGLSLLVAELILGRKNGFSLLKTFKLAQARTGHAYGWIARFGLAIGFIISAYYAVISGWVIYYIYNFLVGLMSSNNEEYISSLNLSTITDNGFLQFLLAAVHIVICGYIVAKNLTIRFEKIFKRILPLFVVMVFVLLIRSLTLDSTSDALRFLFYPDFSKLNLSSLGQAVGHVLYTLSIGMGIMVTFGSYFDQDEDLPRLAFRVTAIDTIVSIVSVLLVFPVLFLNTDASVLTSGSSLLFDSLPRLILKTQWGVVFGLIFLFCLWLVAINGSISLLETFIANLGEKLKILDRKKLSALITFGLLTTVFIISMILHMMTGNQHSLVEKIDLIMINFALPLSALGFSFAFCNTYSSSEIKNQFNMANSQNSIVMYPYWTWFLRYAVPLVITLGLVLQTLVLLR